MKKNFIILLSTSLIALIGFGFSFNSKKLKSKPEKDLSLACSPSDFSGNFDSPERIAIFEGNKIEAPLLANEAQIQNVLAAANEERWVEVDLSEQKLKAWEGDNLFLETPVSTGLPWFPTPHGEFRIWIKLRATRMEGGTGKYYYNLPNVPYVMFFENSQVPGWKGYGLHGTYWHNDFGTQRSHGCVNLPTPIAKELYYWTTPILPEGKSIVYSSEGNPGTRIVIHD